jgi:hypothetical protein
MLSLGQFALTYSNISTERNRHCMTDANEGPVLEKICETRILLLEPMLGVHHVVATWMDR